MACRMKPYYAENGITVYHGEALAVLSELDEQVGSVVTDPPYSSGGMFRGDRSGATSAKYVGFAEEMSRKDLPDFVGDSRDQRGYAHWAALWLAEALRLTVDGGLGFVFADWRQLPTTTDALQAGGWTWRGVVTWDKGHARPIKGRFRANTEFCAWGSRGPLPVHVGDYPGSVVAAAPPRDKQHATQKPVAVLTHLLRVAPMAPVLDPFMGTGTTLRAAKDTGRRAIGIEIEERYCEIAVQRLAQEVLPLETAV